MRFDEVLRTFGAFFDREGIRWAVIGGMAMHAWGASRFTKDIDFVVPRADRDRVVAFTESLGFETFNLGEGYSNHEHPDGTRIDFMFVNETTAGRIFGAAVPKPVIGDVTAPVASAEHLAMMKALAMKNSTVRVHVDAEDIRLLLSLPNVDRDVIRDYFSQIGLLGLFDAIEKTR